MGRNQIRISRSDKFDGSVELCATTDAYPISSYFATIKLRGLFRKRWTVKLLVPCNPYVIEKAYTSEDKEDAVETAARVLCGEVDKSIRKDEYETWKEYKTCG